jgi:hypothetical protein
LTFTIAVSWGTWFMREVSRTEWIKQTLEDNGIFADWTDRERTISGEPPTRRRIVFVGHGNRDTLFVLQVTHSHQLRYYLGSLHS